VLRLTENGRKEHDLRIRKYDRAYEVYRASPPKNRAGDAWQSRLRVPYAMQTIDTALVNLVSGVPRILVKPRHPDDELSAKAMQYALDYYVGQDRLVTKQPTFVQQGLILGVTGAKNVWLYETRKRTVRQFNPDGTEGEPVQQDIVFKDGPSFVPLNMYHTYWEPGAVDADSAGYIACKFYLSKDELLKDQYNPDTGQGLYHNLDELFQTGQPGAPTQSAQERITGINSVDRYKNKFLVEEIWTNDRLTVIGNRQILLRDQENPYWHGRKPIVISQVRPDLFELQGIAETELIDHLQQAQHTLQNMVIDNLHLTTLRGFTYREGGVTDPNQLDIRPRAKWPVSDHDDIRPIEVPPLSSDVFQERQRLLADMQLVTGINPYISGSDLNSVDQNTATGVTALQEVASRLLRFKASQIQNQGYQPSYEMWSAMTQQFMDKDLMLKVIGPDGKDAWATVGPQDIAGDYDLVIEGSEQSLSKQQEQAAATQLLNIFTPLIQLGQVNAKPLVEKVAAAFGVDNVDQLLAVAQGQQQAPAAPYAQQPTGGTGAQNIQQLLGGQSMNPAVQQAITGR
jgi:hypothetical protein